MVKSIGKAISDRLARIRRRSGPASPAANLYYRHPLPIRIMHWTNAVAFFILLMSGLNIFNAHPALNWGLSSYNGVPPVLQIWGGQYDNGKAFGTTRILGHDFNTTGFLGVSKGPDGQLFERAFPYWLTIPDYQWLAMARHWHFFFAWLLVVNGIAFLIYSLLSGHLRGDLLPTRRDWRSIGRSVIDHILFRHPKGEEARHYNILQKLAYLSVILFLLPLMVIMGLGMSPALDAVHPGWVDLFFGRQSMRTIHFIVAWTLVLFVLVHVFEVIVSGLWNNLRSMLTGYYRIGLDKNHE